MAMNLKSLKTAMSRVNGDPAFRKLGTCDAVMGIKAGKRCYAVTFDAFEVDDVREIPEEDLLDVDFYLDMRKKEWDELLADVAGGKQTDLNQLDLERGIVNAKSERLRHTFLQYYLTFQRFIEAAA